MTMQNDLTGLTDAALRDALEEANIPTLLLALTHLTGDAKWLEPPFRPTRTFGLSDNDTGGHTDEMLTVIRDEAARVLRDLRDGVLPLAGPPRAEDIPRLLSSALGDDVPEEYGPSMSEEAGFHVRGRAGWTDRRPERADSVRVLIIGAGLSGLAAARMLTDLGIEFTVVERQSTVGGVWNENTYPGAGVDTPSHLYALSFFPWSKWTRYYAKQPEIHQYAVEAAADLGITKSIRFNTSVSSANWDDAEKAWVVELETEDGATEVATADFVVSCAGLLNQPITPDLPGADKFGGPMFHSSRWDHDVDLDGKTVAVIGSGATSVQLVPAIADTTKRAIVFQRTPQWIAPNPNYLRDLTPGAQTLMNCVPYYENFYRIKLIWQFQDKLLASVRRDPEWPHPERSVSAANDKHRAFLTKHIDEKLADREDLRDLVLPTYPPYLKRMLMDNQWIETLRRDDVEVVPRAVVGFEEGLVVDSEGAKHPADVVVFATGFHTHRLLAPMDIRGRSGVTIREAWGDEDASAYLGITVPDFPNLFLVGGPHTFLGHGGSALYVAECAITYIKELLVQLVEGGIAAVEPRSDVTEEYNRRIDEEHARLIWTHPGVENWFRNSAGRVVSTIPWRGVDYWELTKEPQLEDFVVTSLRDAVALDR